MKWNHLPVPGGLYDQHPKLLDDFQKIMAADADAQKKRNKQQMGGASKKPSSLGRRPRGRR